MSRITEKVVAEMAEWASRPLDAVYVAVFIDAIVVKVRDGQVANRPVYAAIGVTVEGCKDVLGLWAGTAEGARFWMSVLTDLKNRGARDVFFVVWDGVEATAQVVGNVWPLVIVETCMIDLIRTRSGVTSRRDSDATKREIRPIDTAPNADVASAARMNSKKNGVINMRDDTARRTHGPSSFTFLDHDTEIRTVICRRCDRIPERALPARGRSGATFRSEQAGAQRRGL